MKTELAKLELYKSQLVTLKSSLTDVPSNVYDKGWTVRPPLMGALDNYLESNDCLTVPDFQMCYLHTRLLLIATTKELDASNDRINNLNQVVEKLSGNIHSIIDNFDDKKIDQKTKMSVKVTNQ